MGTIKKYQINELVQTVKDWLTKEQKCFDAYNVIKDKILKQSRDDEILESIESIISKNITTKNQKISDEIVSYRELFYCLIIYHAVKANIDNIKKIHKEKIPEIEGKIKRIKLNNQVLTRLFKQKEIQQQYDTLTDFLESNEFEVVNKTYSMLYESKYNDNDILWYYNQNRKQLLDSIKKINPRIRKSQTISKIQSDFKICKEYCRDWPTVFEKGKAAWEVEIIKDIDKAITVDGLAQLKNAPISELNKVDTKIPVKLLEKNGFNTIESVFKAPAQSLSSVPGISENCAYRIKAAAFRVKRLLHDEKKPFTLNYDDKTSDKTRVIKDVYLARKYFQVAEDYSNLPQIDCSSKAMQKAFESIDAINNVFQWLFAEDNARNTFIKAYWELDSLKKKISAIPKYEKVWEEENKYSVGKGVLDSLAWNDFKDNSVDYINFIERIYPGVFSNKTKTDGLSEELTQAIEQEFVDEDNITGILRPYQMFGVKFALHQKRVIIGDEMGLGKTLQSIAVMVSLKKAGYNYFVVICPAAVLLNWCREIRKFSKLSAFQAHGKERDVMVKSWLVNKGVLVTNYETYKTLNLPEQKIDLLVVDEAHYIKNDKSKRSQVVRSACEQVERIMFLTGTPIENSVNEFISLISVLDSNLANSLEQYKAISFSNQFKKYIAPVYLRRKQEDVTKEIPEKIDTTDWCELSEEERDEYDDVLLATDHPFMPSRRVSWMMDDLKKSSKARRVKDIVEEAKKENRKTIIFSFFLDTIEKVEKLFQGECVPAITGSTSSEKRQETIDDFSSNPDMWVLPAQISSGGTGLNIQAASVVIICEPQIKPSIENQAIGRAHRIGQNRTVLVHHLCCENTIEDRILEILKRKQEEFDAFADESVAGNKSLEVSVSDIKTMVEEEVKLAKERKMKKESDSDYSQTLEGQEFIKEDKLNVKMAEDKIENQDRKRTITDSMRQYILRRDNFTCQHCGAKGPGAGGTAELHVDHKLPFSKGGTDDESNLWTLCKECNLGKGNKYDDSNM